MIDVILWMLDRLFDLIILACVVAFYMDLIRRWLNRWWL